MLLLSIFSWYEYVLFMYNVLIFLVTFCDSDILLYTQKICVLLFTSAEICISIGMQ